MKTPCEIIVGKFLPQIRSLVAIELKDKYALKTHEIAKLVGTGDSAVSQYLHGMRGAQSEFLRDFPEIQPFVESVSKELYDNKDGDMELTHKLGDICSALRNNNYFIEMYSNGKGGATCGICFKEIE